MERFQKNLAAWLSQSPQAIQEEMEAVVVKKPSTIFFCTSESGAPNLKGQTAQSTVYLHSQIDPIAEAKQWFSSLNLTHIKAIFIYGIGLGYYYEAAVNWLREEKNRYLIFLEDDADVFHCFLETERCCEILADPQVKLTFLTDSIGQRVFQFTRLSNLFISSPFVYTGLECYSQNKPAVYLENKSTLAFMINMSQMLLSETKSYGIPFFRNYFFNLFDLPTSYFGNHLFGKFQGTPAIICGAGPSLNKNVELLATLQDKALIFAGGTALNALNGKGVMPHFGVGIDPNPDQFTRLIMNQAYETPFLYRCRMLHEALNMVHGDRLIVTGSGGYKIGTWLEKELGVEEQELEEGFNVLNFSVLIAQAMGCNPIICVGIDLAYSNGDSYASGVINHPIHNLRGNFRTKCLEEELVSKLDIYGKPIFTLWKWIAESMWYTHFFDNHPQTTLINATEGGIGFPHVPNMTLKSVQEKYLTKQLDLASYLHGAIQNSPMPESYNENHITKVVRELIDSLSRCGTICQDIVKSLSKQIEDPLKNESGTEEIAQEVAKLFKEKAYEAMLSKFNDDYLRCNELEMSRLIADKQTLANDEFIRQKAVLDRERYHFLKETAFMNSGIVYNLLNTREAAHEALKSKEKENQIHIEELRSTYPVPAPSPEDEYFFDSSCYRIKDRELGLDYEEVFTPEKKWYKESLFYPNGRIKFETSYLNDTLHGPSFFWSENGSLLASSWFIDGKQQGKAWTYYPNGALHSLKFFQEGLKVGLHRYFYSSGLPKSLLPYHKGVLDGEVLLYNYRGLLQRHLRFVKGKRCGLEQIWDNQGQLRIECQYENDHPMGFSRMWHSNGILAKEVVYDQNFQRVQEKEWDTAGVLIEKVEGDDYFDQMNTNTNRLTTSLSDMVNKLSELTPLFSEKIRNEDVFTPVDQKPSESDFSQELEKLKKEMDHLHSLDGMIKSHLSDNDNDPKEAIWKNPSSRKQLKDQFEAIQEQINQEMEKIQKGIKTVVSSLLDKENPKNG